MLSLFRDLSFDNLTGKIPENFGALSSINYMYLTNNLLTGNIPQWIFSSRGRLDISNNNFTGPYPPTYCQEGNVNLVASHSSTYPETSSCEAFPTYPRTYDMVHAEGLLSLEAAQHHRCTTLDLFLEIDRILRPEVIADNVGDNVGDIARMGSDLFGSYAESTCAALFIASTSSFGINHDFSAMSYPLIVSSTGIVACLITTLFATDIFEVKGVSEIEPTLKRQLLMSTILMTARIAVVSFVSLPSEFTLCNAGTVKIVKNWHLFFCVSIG